MDVWILSAIYSHRAAVYGLSGAVQNRDAQIAASQQTQIEDRILVALD
jgi:hypothetical protein